MEGEVGQVSTDKGMDFREEGLLSLHELSVGALLHSQDHGSASLIVAGVRHSVPKVHTSRVQLQGDMNAMVLVDVDGKGTSSSAHHKGAFNINDENAIGNG